MKGMFSQILSKIDITGTLDTTPDDKVSLPAQDKGEKA